MVRFVTKSLQMKQMTFALLFKGMQISNGPKSTKEVIFQILSKVPTRVGKYLSETSKI